MEYRTVVLVRPVPSSLPKATVAFYGEKQGSSICFDTALMQHIRYVEVLKNWGLEVHIMDGAMDQPDSCFIEDRMVVAKGLGLLTYSAHGGRRLETPGIRRFFTTQEWPIHWIDMEAPACLDGGDVLRLGDVFFVGLSHRTNLAGARLLEKTFASKGYSVRLIPIHDHCLHLKSVCSSPMPGVVLLLDGTLDPALFKDQAQVVVVPKEEAHGANCIGWEGHVMMPLDTPMTTQSLVALGADVIAVDNTEFQKADGALTCLSVFLDMPTEREGT